MKVILKPAGVLVVIGAFGILAFLAIPRMKSPESGGAAVGNPGGSLLTTSVISAPASGSGGGKELSEPSRSAVNWSKSKRILEPDITGKNWRVLISKGKVENQVVPVKIPGHSFARRIVIGEIGSNPWELQIAHTLDVAFKKGSHVRLTYWGRSKDGCSLAAVVEEAKDPYTKVTSRITKLTPEWKQYSEEWLQTADTAPGWAHIDFQVGYQVGEIELTGVQLDSVE